MDLIIGLIFWGGVAYLLWRWWRSARATSTTAPASGSASTRSTTGSGSATSSKAPRPRPDRQIPLDGASPPIELGDVVWGSFVRHVGGEDEAEFLADVQAAVSSGTAIDYGVQIAGGQRFRIPGFAHASFAIDSASGRWASGVRLSHEAIGNNLAWDISSVDGMNGVWKPDNTMVQQATFLLTGGKETIDESRRIVDGVLDVDMVFTAGQFEPSVAFLEWAADAEDPLVNVFRCEPNGDGLRLITSLTEATSMETMQPHPSGAWILIGGSKVPRLVDAETGESYVLPMEGENPGWWPDGGDGAAIGCRSQDDQAMLFTYDLASGSETLLGPVEGVPAEWDDLFRWRPHSFTAGPDGTLYCLSGLGVSPEHSYQNGTRDRVHMLDLSTRTLVPTDTALLGPTQLFERIHTRPKRTRPLPMARFELADALGATGIPRNAPPTEPGPIAASKAGAQFYAGLNAYVPDQRIQRVDAALAALMPAALETIKQGDPGLYQRNRQAIEDRTNAILLQSIMNSSADEMASRTGPWQIAADMGHRVMDVLRS